MTIKKEKQSTRTLRLLSSLMAAAMMLLVTGCLKNNIPYPRIQPNFLSVDTEGLLKAAEIDSANRMVTLTFDESVDIRNVRITSYEITPGARVVDANLYEPMDLSKYFICTLELYQEYDWVFKGVQDIERYFTVENQVGPSIIDVGGRRVKVDISSNNGGLRNVKILTAKLGPEGSTISPALTGETVNLSRPMEVEVTAFGRTEMWTIVAEEVVSNVQTVRADAWTNVAFVYGSGLATNQNGVEYRLYGTGQWIKAPAAWVTDTGGTFNARLINLQPETEYEARAFSGEEVGDIVRFTTGSIFQMPNSSFSEWSLNGKIWQPWGEGQTPYWDTGNKGATTLGSSNVQPTDDTSDGTGKAAMLKTEFKGIGVIGKLASGSIFAGTYVKTDGTNGILDFGRPCGQRPTKLRGYFKYTTAPISKTNTQFASLMGQPDTCIVWCALTDASAPFECRTNPKNLHLFDPTASDVIAYGKMQCGQNVPQYIPFEIELEYYATDRVPTYLLVVASSSKYGDYFTGGEGAVMWLDDLELLYDY